MQYSDILTSESPESAGEWPDDACAEFAPYQPSLLAGTEEASRVLGVLGVGVGVGGDLEHASRTAGNFFAVLRLRASETGRKLKPQQTSYHTSQLREVIHAIERSNTKDVYFGHARFATGKGRTISNVREVQVAWVDVDCYALGLEPTAELVEKLTERAAFCGIPRPSHIVSSGRGFYLKWLLTSPVAAADLPAWNALQRRLASLYADLGADYAAMDAARVLRVVGSINSKAELALSNTGVCADRAARAGRVGVIWDTGLRHSFASLCNAVSLIDIETTKALATVRSKILHKAGLGAGAVPVGTRGDLSTLLRYGAEREPKFAMPEPNDSGGGSRKSNGFSQRTLAWSRFLDLRDLMHARARKAGRSGIGEGSRDLGLFWMVDFLAHSKVVRSDNLAAEVRSLLPAFDGAYESGPHGFNPLRAGHLKSLLGRIEAREAGKQVSHAGKLWDPVYTPSNDHLIDLFGIEDSEMSEFRTIISAGEKLRRSDLKEPGRLERRTERKAWQAEALSLRAKIESKLESSPAARSTTALSAGAQTSPIARAVAKTVAAQLGVEVEDARRFFERTDKAAALKAARARGDAPPKRYRHFTECTQDEMYKRAVTNKRAAWNKRVRLLKAAGVDLTGLDDAGIQAIFDAQCARPLQVLADMAADAIQRGLRKEIDGFKKYQAKLDEFCRNHWHTGKAGTDGGEVQSLDEACAPGFTGVAQIPTAAVAPQSSQNADGALGADDEADAFSNDRLVVPRATAGRSDLDSAQELALHATRHTLANYMLCGSTKMRDNPNMSANEELPAQSLRPPPVGGQPGGDVPGHARAFNRAKELLEKVQRARGKLAVGKATPAAPPAATPPGMRVAHEPLDAESAVDFDRTRPVFPPQEDLRALQDDAPIWMPNEPPIYEDESWATETQPALQRPDPALRSPVPATTNTANALVSKGLPNGPNGSGVRGFTVTHASAPPALARQRAQGEVSASASASSPLRARVGFGAQRSTAPTPSANPAAETTAKGGFAKLSSEQASWNNSGANASDDFHLRLPSPKAVLANGQPASYPDAATWPDSSLPAGSRYTAAEWLEARVVALATGAKFVHEVQVGNPIVSVLLAVPSALASESGKPEDAYEAAGTRTRVVNGKVQKLAALRSLSPPWDDPFGRMLDGVIVVSRSSPAVFPGAVEGGVEIADSGHISQYRIIRPREHYDDPEREMLVNSKLRILAAQGVDRRPDVVGFPPSNEAEVEPAASDELLNEEQAQESVIPRGG